MGKSRDLIIEDLEHALNRVQSYTEKYQAMRYRRCIFIFTAPASDADGAYRAMLMAVNDAGIKGRELDYINAHELQRN